MEMSIAEPIQTLEYLRDSGVFPFSSKEGMLYTVESIDAVIETMRKYQNIQEIVKNRNIKPPLTTLNRIIKVVENGID